MEISRRLFIFLVSTVIGFMLALVVAVGVLVVRGPAGQLHAAHAVSPGEEGLFEEEEEVENRLSEIDDESTGRAPSPEPTEEATEKTDSEELTKLGSLSPEARALFEDIDDDDVAEEGGTPKPEKGAPPAPSEQPAPVEQPLAEDEVPANAAAAPDEAHEELKPKTDNELAPPSDSVGSESVHVEAVEPAAAASQQTPLKPAPGDSDGDGIPDGRDGCVDQPEDKDGFLDRDGCPDLDNDGDKVLDLQDKCPFEKETPNGYQDSDGCPDDNPSATAAQQPAAVPAERAAPAPEGKTLSVYFGHMRWALTRLGKRIAKKAVRAVLESKNGSTIYIRGHSDAGGRAAVNRWYANKRSKSVRKFLVSKGVSLSRIVIMDAVILNGGQVNDASRDKASRRVDIIVAE